MQVEESWLLVAAVELQTVRSRDDYLQIVCKITFNSFGFTLEAESWWPWSSVGTEVLVRLAHEEGFPPALIK